MNKIINFTRKVKKFKIMLKKIDKALVRLFSLIIKIIDIIEFVDKIKAKNQNS